MRVIKRSGQEVVFDEAKIKNAIIKANLSIWILKPSKTIGTNA